MRVYYPFLAFDGDDASIVEFEGASVRVSLQGSAIRFSILKPNDLTLRLSSHRLFGRNGEMGAVYAELPGQTATYRIEPAAR